MSSVEKIAREITGRLRELGQGRRDAHRPTVEDDLGIPIPQLRRVVNEYRDRVADESGDFVYRLGLRLVEQKISECRQFAYEMIAAHPEARNSLTTKRIETLGDGMDNWAAVDGFCCFLAGEAWREGRISDAAIHRWSRSDDLWWRRAAVVATVPLNLRSRGGSGDSVRTLTVCESLVADEEIMVQKAISWALRALIVWDRGSVEDFLQKHEDRISALVRREVRTKLATGRKNG